MHIAILGRQPNLGIAELEQLFGSDSVEWFSDTSATIETPELSIELLGGTQKAGRAILELPYTDWRKVSMQIVRYYEKEWAKKDGKLTLGISAYGFTSAPRDIQKTGIILKQRLKEKNVSLRLIPNAEAALNTATSHHNKLGLSDNKVELLVVKGKNSKTLVAESTGSQNITSLAKRDQGRPKRDAFVGMLPPKLAQIMINLARPKEPTGRILDPFCGTGVVLQEAALMRYPVYGTDLSAKMIDYSHANLKWLEDAYGIKIDQQLHEGDAMETTWQQPIDAVVCEGYLGQPFSAPPSPEKLAQVRKNCNHIMSTFLKNVARQIKPGTPLCIGVPAWRDATGKITHLPLISNLEELGFTRVNLKNTHSDRLLYYREDQVVARELLVLVKA